MKMFVWNYLDEVSSNYHTGGGLAVVAKDEDHVKELVKSDKNIKIEASDWEKVHVYELKKKAEPKIYVFPDAGCC